MVKYNITINIRDVAPPSHALAKVTYNAQEFVNINCMIPKALAYTHKHH